MRERERDEVKGEMVLKLEGERGYFMVFGGADCKRWTRYGG